MTKYTNPRSANDIDAHVGKRLKVLRRKHNLSQSELGSNVFVTFQQIQKYEMGQNRISVSRLWKFCEFFNVRPNYFFEGLSDTRKVTNSELSALA